MGRAEKKSNPYGVITFNLWGIEEKDVSVRVWDSRTKKIDVWVLIIYIIWLFIFCHRLQLPMINN